MRRGSVCVSLRVATLAAAWGKSDKEDANCDARTGAEQTTHARSDIRSMRPRTRNSTTACTDALLADPASRLSLANCIDTRNHSHSRITCFYSKHTFRQSHQHERRSTCSTGRIVLFEFPQQLFSVIFTSLPAFASAKVIDCQATTGTSAGKNSSKLFFYRKREFN